jgi:membrane peptidoglycan carboxypeptidase
VFEGGLSIYTTLQPVAQQAAEQTVKAKLAGRSPDGALASVEPNTGKIIAMVSGKNFKENQVNLAVLGQGGSGYHSGSTFKVFYLVSALEQGLKPSLSFHSPPEMTIKDPACPEGWHVGNAEQSEGGDFNMYTGVQKSVNTYFAQLMTKVRPHNAVEVARRMGIKVAKEGTRDYANHWNVCSSVLGTGNISVLDMASAFGVLANDGVRCQPYSIAEVRDRDGKVLLDRNNKSSCERVISQGVSRQVVDMLRGVVNGGTGFRAALPGRPLAGKTGTAQDYTSAMFTGFTPQLATSVWVGHRSGLIPMRTDFFGSRVFGGTFPAEIFHDFMLAALQGKPVLNFPPPPEGRPQNPKGDRVPSVVGRQLAEAAKILRQAGYGFSVRQAASGAPKGQVVAQSPGGGSPAAKGTTVLLTVSQGGGGGGNRTVVVPNVVGQRASDATAAIRRAGLRPEVTYALALSRGQVGKVLRQSPGGGSRVPKGSTVILVVGRRLF